MEKKDKFFLTAFGLGLAVSISMIFFGKETVSICGRVLTVVLLFGVIFVFAFFGDKTKKGGYDEQKNFGLSEL